MSSRFGTRKPELPPYLWTPARLSIYQLSNHSLFGDTVWKFDTLVAGKSVCGVNWALDTPNEIWKLQPFQRLVRDAKRVLLAHIIEKRLRPQSIVLVGTSLRLLVRWMYLNGYRSFCQLDAEGRKDFFEFVCAQYFDDDRSLKVTGETIDRHMHVITALFHHRELLATQPRLQIPIDDMRGLFWAGAGRKKGGKEPGTIPALPDKVFDPLMEEALRWLNVYSADIIDLMKIEADAAERCAHWRSKNKTYYINRHLVGFRFSNNPLTGRPWRNPLSVTEDKVDVDETGVIRQKLGPLGVLRGLINSLLAACSVVMQGFTGLRISELLGLRAEASSSTDPLPSCIIVRPSADGLNQVFLFCGEIFKGADVQAGRDGQWVVGIRPSDSEYVPEAVRALLLVLKIVEGWRGFTEHRNVFIHPKAQGMPRSIDSVGAARSNLMRKLQQQFLKEWVELPVDFSGWHLSTHQFRKKFAQDIVRCDPGALPAVREHFKHMSMHVLETGYIGSDGELLGLIDDVALRDAATQIMAIIDGEPAAGMAADAVKAAVPRFKEALNECGTQEGRRKQIEMLIVSEGVKAWPCDFGTCLFRSETARCHFAGRGFYDPSALKPLASERCADLCCTCSNLVVSARNLQYWKDRYVHNERLQLVYREERNAAWGFLASRRARVAENILRAHSVSPEDLAHAA